MARGWVVVSPEIASDLRDQLDGITEQRGGLQSFFFAKVRKTRNSMSEDNTSAGSSGVSRPRSVINMILQAMTRLMAM